MRGRTVIGAWRGPAPGADGPARAGAGAPLVLPGLSAVAALAAALGALLRDPAGAAGPGAILALSVVLGAVSALVLARVGAGLPVRAGVLRALARLLAGAELAEVGLCLAALVLRPAWTVPMLLTLAGLAALHAAARLTLAVVVLRGRGAADDAA